MKEKHALIISLIVLLAFYWWMQGREKEVVVVKEVAKEVAQTSNNQKEDVQEQTIQEQGTQKPKSKLDELSEVVLMYLAQPKFSAADLGEQVTGTKAELELLDLKEGFAYFSLPEESYTKEKLALLSKNPEGVEFGTLKNDQLVLGEYVYPVPGRYLFRLLVEDFKVNPQAVIKVPLGDVTYTMSLQELTDLAKDRTVYEGKLRVKANSTSTELPTFFYNHGAFVAKKGEKSLRRLVDQIIPKGSNKLVQAQELLDFTTSQLSYQGRESLWRKEVLKRPNEVLMTGGSDCSGLVILYASLLEQTEIDYLLLYIRSESSSVNHVAVAVETDEAVENELGFSLGGKNFAIAEVTIQGFEIGRSRLKSQYGMQEIEFLQRPREKDKIFNAKSGEPATFAE